MTSTKAVGTKKKAPPEKLPKTFFVGDKVKLRDDCIGPYSVACKAAGWSFDTRAIRTITRIEFEGPSGRPYRLYVEGIPHMFWPSDVLLAWNSDGERRKALGK